MARLLATGIVLAACAVRPAALPPTAAESAPLASVTPAGTGARETPAATSGPFATIAAVPTSAPLPGASPAGPSSPGPVPTLGPTRLGRIENFIIMGHAALDGRGWNAGLALAFPCAYVGSRLMPGIAIVDVRDPAVPVLVGQLSLAPGTLPVELRAVPDLGLLVVLNFSPVLSVITFDVHDCAHPRPLGSIGLGVTPHEFYLWRDPAQPARVLLFLATWGGQPDLLVVDASDPANLHLTGSWTAAGDGVAGMLHSMSLSPDGQRAYLALWNGGFLVADSSDFALSRADPHLRIAAPAAGPSPLPGRQLHSVVALPDPRYVFLTQEVYTCPFAGALIADISDPARPRLAGQFELPENDPACGSLPGPDAVFAAHNPVSAGPLVFVTWYGGGLQALNVSDPAHPTRVGLFVPDGSGPSGGSPYGNYAAQLWSYPILRQGLIYVSDIKSGLYILHYTGPEAGAVDAIPLAEGNASVAP